jgi:hypothetical protein
VIKRFILLAAFTFFVSLRVNAQPGPPDDPDVPITGIEILIGAGGAIGLKRILDRKKKMNN